MRQTNIYIWWTTPDINSAHSVHGKFKKCDHKFMTNNLILNPIKSSWKTQCLYKISNTTEWQIRALWKSKVVSWPTAIPRANLNTERYCTTQPYHPLNILITDICQNLCLIHKNLSPMRYCSLCTSDPSPVGHYTLATSHTDPCLHNYLVVISRSFDDSNMKEASIPLVRSISTNIRQQVATISFAEKKNAIHCSYMSTILFVYYCVWFFVSHHLLVQYSTWSFKYLSLILSRLGIRYVLTV